MASITYGHKVFIFIIITFLARVLLLYTTGIQFAPDEAYYYLWSKNLALSYYDGPPMMAYLIAGANLLFSNKVFAAHFVSNILFCGTSVFIYLFCKEFLESKTAFYCTVLINILLIYIGEGIYVALDISMIFFLTGAMYLFYVALKKERPWMIILACIFTGFAMLSKYIAFFIYPSFFLYLLLPENRKWFLSAYTYIAFILSILIFAPVIYWNYSNHWASFGFQIGGHFVGDNGSFTFRYFGEFIGLQILLGSPVNVVIFIFTILYLIIIWKKCTLPAKYLWFISFVPFLFFMLYSFKDRVLGNWPCFVYIPGTILSLYIYEKILKNRKIWRFAWKLNWTVSIIIAVFILIVINIPAITVKIDKCNDFFGWDQLGAELVKLKKEYPGYILSTGHYAYASEAEVYSGEKIGAVVGAPKQFQFWVPDKFSNKDNYIFFNPGKNDMVASMPNSKLLKKIAIKREGKTILEFYIYLITSQKNGRLS